MRVSVGITLAAGTLLAACASTPARGFKSSLDAWKAQLTTSSQSFESTGAVRPKAAVGQWAEYLQLDDKKNPSRVIYRLVGEEPGAVWLEIESTDYEQKVVSKLRLAVKDWQDARTWAVDRIFVQRDGETATEVPVIESVELIRSLLAGLQFGSVADAAGEDVTVTAGTFAGASGVASGINTRLGVFQATTWVHGQVPVTGCVRSLSVDGGHSMELVAFGSSGAKSAIGKGR